MDQLRFSCKLEIVENSEYKSSPEELKEFIHSIDPSDFIKSINVQSSDGTEINIPRSRIVHGGFNKNARRDNKS